MTVPVIKNVLLQNPTLQVTVVSNNFYEPLFAGLERCNFYPAFLKTEHKGVAGIFRLYKALKQHTSFDAIVDLHGVLRSQLLATFFKFQGLKNASINKGRSEKKTLTRKHNKILHQLKTMHQRYADVFRKVGCPVKLNTKEPIYNKRPLPDNLELPYFAGKKIIGIAPFAQYTEKMYRVEKMKKVVQQLSVLNHTILLFGGGKIECETLEEWEKHVPGVINIAGKYSLADELSIISNVDCMVSMDSANMHLASLFNIPVVSVWGATHSFAGFNGYNQDIKNMVQSALYCRPCSVFGNKPCYRGDHACMNLIDMQMIIDKIESIK